MCKLGCFSNNFSCFTFEVFNTLSVSNEDSFSKGRSSLYYYRLEWAERRLENVFSKWNVFQCVDMWKGVSSSWKMRCIKKQYLLGELQLS